MFPGGQAPLRSPFFFTVHPEPVEGLSFLGNAAKEGEPFDRLRANGSGFGDFRRNPSLCRDPDEIASKGFFCANVMTQQAGAAFRVLHAGKRRLPEGTVIICPPGVEPALIGERALSY